MADEHLLRLKLNALARAHELDYFADGHRGASMVAAHQLCQNRNLDERARVRIRELVDLNWASSALCEPFPEAVPEPGRIDEIGLALVEGAETLRQVGHNAIFAMLAIKAFRSLPSFATSQHINGACDLIRALVPWRDIDPDPEINPPAIQGGPASWMGRRIACSRARKHACGGLDSARCDPGGLGPLFIFCSPEGRCSHEEARERTE